MTEVDGAALPPGVAKRAMQVFLGLLVVNALIAIAAVLGATGDSEWKVVGTTLLLTAACLTIAANAAALERNRLGPLPFVAAGLACVAFAIFIVLVWVEPSSDSSVIYRFTFGVLTVGLAATYAGLLAIPNLSGAFAIARMVGSITVSLLAALIVVALIIEEGGPAETYAILCIVLATATVIVLTGAIVSHRNEDTSATASALHGAASAVGVHCPSCASVVGPHLATGSYECPSCGLGFRLEVIKPPTA